MDVILPKFKSTSGWTIGNSRAAEGVEGVSGKRKEFT